MWRFFLTCLLTSAPCLGLLNQQELVYERLTARNSRTSLGKESSLLYITSTSGSMHGNDCMGSMQRGNKIGNNTEHDLVWKNAAGTPWANNTSQNSMSEPVGFFPFIIPPYKIGVVTPGPCTAANGFEGTCLTRTKCSNIGGSAYESCGTNNRGVCCVNARSCGTSTMSTTTARVTYFTSPGFSSTFNEARQCQLTVYQQNANVCQLRIDFINLILAPPSYEDATYGRCITDSLVLGNPGLPALCGENNGHHVYVNFNPNAAFHRITIDTSNANGDFDRMWNLKITQIQCNSTERAPPGCLMYYNETSGTVSSFNFGEGAPPNVDTTVTTWTRQITGLHYGICVKPAQDICWIQWTAASANDFSVSIVDTAMNTPLCTQSYIVIPRSPITTGNAQADSGTDRVCGIGSPANPAFPEDGILTETMPFVLYVITNLDANVASQTRGFRLSYRQIACPVF